VRQAAQHPCCPPAFRAYIDGVADRQYVPPELLRVIRVSKAVVAAYRSPKQALLATVYTPHILRKHPSAERRLRAGEMLSSDDGSVNFIVQVPWPWGGDACSERYGVRVGRFQVLPILDCASGYVPYVAWVVRSSDAYRAEDLIALMGGAMRQYGMWDSVYLERGSWEAASMNEFFERAKITRYTAYLPQQKLIENWWNTTWTYLSRLPGQIGRFRGEEAEGNRRLTAYHDGRRDPRGEILTIGEAMTELQRVIHARNQERIDAGPLFGSWIPAERWQSDLAARPMRPLPADLDHLLLPERKTLMVRRHCVHCTALSPLGERNTYMFFDEALIPLEGQYVQVYFDPHHDPVRAAIFHGDTLVCAAATCISRAPAVVERGGTFEVAWDGEFRARAEEAKRRARTWVRREHRAIAPDGSLDAWRTEQRGPTGMDAAAMSRTSGGLVAPAADPLATTSPESAPVASRLAAPQGRDSARGGSFSAQPPDRNARPDPTEADMAELEALERQARSAGIIPVHVPDPY